MLTRRLFIGAGAATAAAFSLPRMALARANTNRRFVFIIQRGAADGLSILGPTGDPLHASIRGDFDRDLRNGARLGSFFTLHPALAEAGKMYAARQALFVHAVASPYRDRSHFDGQNVLETGGSAAYQLKDGWLNRLLSLLPGDDSKALALSDTVPMALRGSNQVSSYAPSKLAGPSEDLLQRVAAMYDPDAQLHALWSEAVATRMTAGNVDATGQNGAAIGSIAAKLLGGDSGARIAMIETNGWDTHSGQRGRLAAQLKNLDAIAGALKRDGLGGHAGDRRDRVWPHGPPQRHRRHRPRRGVGRDAPWRRGRWWTGHRGLARALDGGPVRGPRSQADEHTRFTDRWSAGAALFARSPTDHDDALPGERRSRLFSGPDRLSA